VLMGTAALSLVLPLHRYCCTGGSPRHFSPARPNRPHKCADVSCPGRRCYADAGSCSSRALQQAAHTVIAAAQAVLAKQLCQTAAAAVSPTKGQLVDGCKALHRWLMWVPMRELE
jgi:hypothetical protein